MEKSGLHFLSPIRNLIEDKDYLCLSYDKLHIDCSTYTNNFKRSLEENEESIESAVKCRFRPGLVKLGFFRVT